MAKGVAWAWEAQEATCCPQGFPTAMWRKTTIPAKVGDSGAIHAHSPLPSHSVPPCPLLFPQETPSGRCRHRGPHLRLLLLGWQADHPLALQVNRDACQRYTLELVTPSAPTTPALPNGEDCPVHIAVGLPDRLSLCLRHPALPGQCRCARSQLSPTSARKL